MANLGLRTPDRIFTYLPDLNYRDARNLAETAVRYARRDAPKLSGVSARGILPIYSTGWFGMLWLDDRVWFQNSGVRPFVMRSLAGKLIPMWIDDPTGAEANKLPDDEKKASRMRVTVNGRRQVLIFRRAARPGQRKLVHRKIAGVTQTVSVPMSYPGAPGRIAVREAPNPYTTAGRQGGQIARHNVGIRWYFPGLTARNFLQNGIVQACLDNDIQPRAIHIGFGLNARVNVATQASATIGARTGSQPRR